MSRGDFTADIWSRCLLAPHENLMRYLLTNHGVGLLHEKPERVRRIEARRLRRLYWRHSLRAWWYRVRAPIRRLGGCHEDDA